MSTGPAWLAGAFAVVMLGIALHCTGRLVTARRSGRCDEPDVDAVHVGMGVAMAGMLAPSANPLAGHAWDLGWTLFFGLAACWFGVRLLVALIEGRGFGSAPAHLVSSGVMLYMMSAAPSTMAGMAGMDMTVTTPVLTLALLGAIAGFAVLAMDRVLAAPRLADCGHIAMSVTMGYMLLLML